MLVTGVSMGIGGVMVGLEHWKEDVAGGAKPFSDPYVQGAIPLILFAFLLIIIAIASIFGAVRRALRRIEEEKKELGPLGRR
jgi:hypothetical protein